MSKKLKFSIYIPISTAILNMSKKQTNIAKKVELQNY